MRPIIIFDTQKKSVQDIINYYKNQQLDLNPSFQRSSVWSNRDRAKLIDSILRNYPLPSIFLYKREISDGTIVYDVIDGKQRLESIFYFIGEMRGNRFQTKTQLDVNGPEEWIDWNDIKRRKLHLRITDYMLQVINVTGEPSDVIDLFIKINSTGKALTGSEVRHARYFKSDFLKRADQIADRYSNYFRATKIISQSQISRMKHIELICELMVSAHFEDVINKKAALDKIMKSESLEGRQLDKAAKLTITSLNRLKRMFPQLGQTRFSKLSDFYSLAVLIQKFEREGLILINAKRNKLAWGILRKFANGVDDVDLKRKKMENTEPGEELYRQYLLTVREGTDEINHRRDRERILQGLLKPLYEKKDSERLFSPEQRRILWNSTTARKCTECRRTLTWEDFTIDHIHPHSKGGQTRLDNAALMCRKHNSQKGNRT
ncbi:MAG: HNH endonuclease family protein [Pyrinomonadaceae bacterium]